ncbi:TPA: GNAT family N-acetyltransferase [Campylobacter jejuni]|nr:GNAT family N-acetyltransferase [Campylobacter jejuni]ECL2361032.1 GNAT family N-acetyltransferase [Campylobacter jejuni]ECL3806619.1 GNAT family N-acetyltransferase [Campylobacter jejuni]ECP8537729.1 GNAT family N-acetyltransferase [Campylobacter jejuni]ECP8551602.1 GNAT family N-acetyltransferase [Campylobacter jejuni]
MIRRAKFQDLNPCVKLFKESVSKLCVKEYTKDQIKAWIKIDKKKWEEKFIKDFIYIYEKQGEIASFISLKEDEKMLDLLFTYPKFTRLGLAKELLDFVLKKYSYKELYVFTSLSAKPFFLKNGFEVIRENEVSKEGQILKNFLMRKGNL